MMTAPPPQPTSQERADDAPVSGVFWPLVLILGLIACLGVVNNTSINAFLPLISVDIGHSVPAIGQITTVAWIIGAVAAIVIGPLADRYGLRWFLLVGVASVVLTASGTAVANSFATLAAPRWRRSSASRF